jgi:23S rRNA (cytosine1962-C5)-methyltransferase
MPGRAAVPAPVIPDGVPIVSLRSASYGAFIYQRMVGGVVGKVQDGDMVAVLDKRGEFFGWGFYNSQSQIALRMFSHQGPMPDDAEIARRIRQAVALRRDVLKLEQTTDAYRLIHAEGDGLSGLVADRFGEYIVIEIFSLAMYRRLQFIQDAFIDAGLSVRNFVARADKSVAEQEGFKVSNLQENKDRQATITENGVKFNVMLNKGHKTGFFCDQRDNRLALTALTPGKSMLDVCCYSGGFSCYAAVKGQAGSITAVDLDENAIAMAQENAQLNNAKIEFNHADAFDYLRQAFWAGRKWDVVVVDPSKFVPRRDTMEIGLRKYNDLNRLACGVVAPGGVLLTCSCSGLVSQDVFTQTVARAARAAGRSMQIFKLSGAGSDHPFMAEAPESAYLKAVWARLD